MCITKITQLKRLAPLEKDIFHIPHLGERETVMSWLKKKIISFFPMKFKIPHHHQGQRVTPTKAPDYTVFLSTG